jgi:DNA polymerase-3 subunit alpha
MFLIFDTETTGLPKRDNAPLEELDNWPRLVQLAWQMHDLSGKFLNARNYIIKPEGFTIPYAAEKLHGISTEKALADGHDLKTVLSEFAGDISHSTLLIAHNIEFDINIVASEFLRNGIENDFLQKKKLCTKIESTDFCAIPGGRGGKFKWPNLAELHFKLFQEGFSNAHNATADVEATTRCFLELLRLGIIKPGALPLSAVELEAFHKANPEQIRPAGVDVKSQKQEPQKEIKTPSKETEVSADKEPIQFTHLHVHTQYSILDGAASIPGLIQKAKENGMKAMAITDHGNLFGAKIFHNEAKKQGIRPIIGCEVYLAKRSRHQKEEKIDASGDHLILLAKNKEGYHNLVKLVSLGWLEGMYYKPRIDKEILRQYSKGLIATTACLGGEIPQEIMNHGTGSAETLLKTYQDIFGVDLYLELMRHKSLDPAMNHQVYKDQVFVNNVLIELGKKHGIKCIATNDVHFVNPEDAGAHDRLICLNTGKDLDDPTRMKYTQQEWFKTREEMQEIFQDIPEVFINIQEIVDKVETYALNRDPIMPDFPLPDGFDNEDVYLRHLSYTGAEKRYPEITPEIKERIDFELDVVKNMGFPGYFLIVQDFINQARKMGVAVGPGRGSAAGSVVAYCTGITDIDPIRYNLLFERFLNPDRISLPDIDIDFDEDGREDILRWVVNKYGKNKVAQIITFGTMAAKMAIRDVARIQKLPLSEADRLAKLVPERPGTTLKKAYEEVPELRMARDSANADIASVLKYAGTLEGSVRHTGIHACGIIIGRDDLIEHIPVCISKDSDLLVTQFDGKNVEDVGMLKMDFLGLKTLSIIKDAVTNVTESKNIQIDISNLPIDDQLTYELYARGDTTGLFQFESAGMRKHLRDLKPNRFEDLIAMNALYRPGPMEYIPSFIRRKHGKEPITYRVPEMEEELKETYGITVYQEQVMRLSQRLAGFTRGQADSLRKAMGKKIRKMMDELKSKFVEGCQKNGYSEEVIEKIWSDWEAFAEYAFNKSHSTCYAYVSYQTAYLKAHHPAEFMAAVLSRNIADIKKIGLFMDECRRMGIAVLGPDVNESNVKFTVNKKGNIRFGLGAIKGVGESAVTTIIEERKKNGGFKDIYDFIERIDLRVMTRKNLEGLASAGAFDCFTEINRAQYFQPVGTESSFFDSLVKYGNRLHSEKISTQQSLFGGSNEEVIMRPVPAGIEDWPLLERINREKELIGMYLTAHPLDRFRPEIKSYCNVELHDLNNRLQDFKGKDVTFAGIIKSFREGISQKNNRAFGIAELEDFTDTYQLRLWGNDFVNHKKYFSTGVSILVKASVEEWTSKKDGRSGTEVRVKSIHLLSEVRNDMVRSILLTIRLNSMSDILIDELNKYIARAEKGSNAKHLRIQVIDKESNLKVDLFSRTQYLNLSDNFFEFMDANPEIEYLLK